MAGPSVNRRWPARGGRRGIGGVGNGINAHSAPQTPRQLGSSARPRGGRPISDTGVELRGDRGAGRVATRVSVHRSLQSSALSGLRSARARRRRTRTGRAGPRAPRGPRSPESRRTVRTTTRKNNIQCNHAVRVFAQTPSPFRRGRAAGPACVDLACAVWLCPVACGLHACTHAGTACGPRLSCARWRCRAPPRAPARGPAGRRTGIGADWRDVNWRW